MFDLLVIGGGSGGVRAANWAAKLAQKKNKNIKIALCEELDLGGTCVLRGCVPKKLMTYAAHFLEEIKLQKFFGHEVLGHTFHWDILKKNRDNEVQRLSKIYRSSLEKNAVSVFYGSASFIDTQTVLVGDKKVQAKNIIIATGSLPVFFEKDAMSSNDIFLLNEQPESIAIVGGGYIGVELAGILNGLGTRVSIVLRGDTILSGHDKEMSKFLQEEMKKKGIHFLVNQKNITLKDVKELTNAQYVLAAIGRKPNVDGLNLNKIGLSTDKKGAIITDDCFQTNIKNIYAIGDCINQVNLTPVAIKQAMIAIENIFDQSSIDKNAMDYSNIPTAIFSDPPMASCGLSDQEITSEHIVYRANFRPMKYSLSDLTNRCYMKMIVRKSDQVVVGVSMIGAEAPDIIQALAVAIRANVTKNIFETTIGIHPTTAEEWVNGM